MNENILYRFEAITQKCVHAKKKRKRLERLRGFGNPVGSVKDIHCERMCRKNGNVWQRTKEEKEMNCKADLEEALHE